MSELDELRQRVAALEDRAGMEGGLRASQDRDLSDLLRLNRAQDHLIQALAITQSDHGDRLTRIEAKIDAIGVNMGIVVDALNALLDRE